jgi:hypothetical protein
MKKCAKDSGHVSDEWVTTLGAAVSLMLIFAVIFGAGLILISAA